MTVDLDRQASGGPADGGRRTATAICVRSLRQAAMATTTEVGWLSSSSSVMPIVS